jgi:hypothetical protein
MWSLNTLAAPIRPNLINLGIVCLPTCSPSSTKYSLAMQDVSHGSVSMITALGGTCVIWWSKLPVCGDFEHWVLSSQHFDQIAFWKLYAFFINTQLCHVDVSSPWAWLHQTFRLRPKDSAAESDPEGPQMSLCCFLSSVFSRLLVPARYDRL